MGPGETRIELDDDTTAFVVIDSVAGNRSMGGLRVAPTCDVPQLRVLARKMTQKLTLANLPIGGAKALLRAALPADSTRDTALRHFGKRVAPLLRDGLYLGTDQGLSYRDRSVVFQAAGYRVEEVGGATALPCSWDRLWKRCASVTGFGVVQGVLEYLDWHPSLARSARTVGIHGFGTVGRAAALLLAGCGYAIVSVTDAHGTIYAPRGLPVRDVVRSTDAGGTIDRTRLPRHVRVFSEGSAWRAIESDIVLLASTEGVLTEEGAPHLGAQLVAEGANGPCTPAARAKLHHRGIDVLPDVGVNAGGAIVTGLVLTGLAPALDGDAPLVAWLYSDVARRIRRTVSELVRRSLKDDRDMHALAQNLAEPLPAEQKNAPSGVQPEPD